MHYAAWRFLSLFVICTLAIARWCPATSTHPGSNVQYSTYTESDRRSVSVTLYSLHLNSLRIRDILNTIERKIYDKLQCFEEIFEQLTSPVWKNHKLANHGASDKVEGKKETSRSAERLCLVKERDSWFAKNLAFNSKFELELLFRPKWYHDPSCVQKFTELSIVPTTKFIANFAWQHNFDVQLLVRFLHCLKQLGDRTI